MSTHGDDGPRTNPPVEVAGGALVVAAALVAVLTAAVLARPLGHRIQPAPLDFWPEVLTSIILPEPTELVRFGIAAAVPIGIAVWLLIAPRGGQRGSHGISMSTAGTIGALAGLGLVVSGWIERSEPATFGLDPQYFSGADLAVAVVGAGLVITVALHLPTRGWVVQRLAGPGPSPVARVALASGLVGLTTLYALPAIYTNDNLGDAPGLTALHFPFTFADFAAFGNGATPLVDFSSQYSNLLPWVAHPVLAAFDYSPGSFTFVMAVLAAATLLALWRALAEAVGSEWVGALLYLPVLAIAMRPTIEAGDERTSNASLVQIVPERYLLPSLVAWACVRHAQGRRPYAPTAIFFGAGLGLLNNPEFGGPALVAAFAAVVVGDGMPPTRRLVRVVLELAGGLTLAAAAVSVLTVARTGSLPDPALLTYFSRLFAAQGFGLTPMPAQGLHLALYVTFVGALLLAVARRPTDQAGRALAAMLAFLGIFGLGSAAYYVGRSNAITLVALFPIWGMALALLAWSTFRWLLGLSAWRALLTPIGGLALCSLVGLGLAATDVPDAPNPWTQRERLRDHSSAATPFDLDAAERYVASRTDPGDSVLLLHENGHLIARATAVRNTSSIGNPGHVISARQLETLLLDLRAADGTAVFLGDGLFLPVYPSLAQALVERGWHRVSEDPASGMLEWAPGSTGLLDDSAAAPVSPAAWSNAGR